MPILFYRVNEPFGCFSNFSRHPVSIDGRTWPTTEHYFQAMKLPDDPERQKEDCAGTLAHEGEADRQGGRRSGTRGLG